MKLNPTAIPQGTRTYLFDAAAHKRFIEQTLHSVMRSRGFQEIVTPPIEYYESMVTGLNEDERNRVIRFTEGDSGRTVALRADITSQVARSAATHLSKRPLPLRLCYTGQVFRRARTGKGEQYVLHQVGMEIMGHADHQADTDVIRAIVAGLEAVTIKDYSLSLGHAGLVSSFLKGIDASCMEETRRALAKKDRAALKKALGRYGIDKEKAEKITALTELHGGREALGKAKEICTDEDSKKELRNLTQIYYALDAAGLGERLSIDIGDTRGFGYYTGITMELFSASGSTLGTGGRYDNLVSRFGLDIPAVGFAFDVDMMIDAVERDSSALEWRASDIFLIGSDDETAQTLRSAGMMVIKPFGNPDEDDAREYAAKMSIPHILIKDTDKDAGENYDWIKTSSGEKAKTTIKDFLNDYFK